MIQGSTPGLADCCLQAAQLTALVYIYRQVCQYVIYHTYMQLHTDLIATSRVLPVLRH